MVTFDAVQVLWDESIPLLRMPGILAKHFQLLFYPARPWTLPSQNKDVVSMDHRLVDTTLLKSGISGCWRKSMDTSCRCRKS